VVRKGHESKRGTMRDVEGKKGEEEGEERKGNRGDEYDQSILYASMQMS
jgi:hypothetical protein